ncbi:hypothetical protein M5X06_25020 [Paenibacillus alvei]|uniref:Phage DNA packaging protein, Nu1 subunit of terminase n=1 Tax=Paenibacillus alvei TaxID=44250 RepID=A0ABT4H890_PAEAL|nr:hypothetical protein [Paenibacillus alvei]MCY7486626.1 hypothetical protein [Paenibacillus alvei]MCY9765104.1 hypothetical protein [Paenibacillus alvei]MCY9770047.1 hypothetical protein [Paenibacillus alvei]NEZ43742.1 hypothetical protein [Paenibacillus alvei]
MAKPKEKGEQLYEREILTSELAAIIGKSPQWIRQLTREEVLEQISRGRYILGESVQKYIKHVEGESSDGKISFRDEKAEHERVKKEMAMLELEEKRKNLHTTDDVKHAWGMLLVEFRRNLTVLPSKLANELSYLTDAREIRIFLEDKINTALQQLAKYDPLSSDGE